MKKYETECVNGKWYLVTRVPLGHAELPKGALTAQEQRVIDLVCELKQNKEIADILNITPRTVKFHVSNVLRKFNCSSRAELIYRKQ